MKVLLGIPDDLLKKLDDYCKVNSYDRSELIRALIRDKVMIYPKDIPSTSHWSLEDLKQAIPGLTTANQRYQPLDTSGTTTVTQAMANVVWGMKNLYCHFCHQSPAKMMDYKYQDGSGEGQNTFCKKCWDKYDGDQAGTKIYSSPAHAPAKQANFDTFSPHSKPLPKKKREK